MEGYKAFKHIDPVLTGESKEEEMCAKQMKRH